jgi:hypothetical protein
LVEAPCIIRGLESTRARGPRRTSVQVAGAPALAGAWPADEGEFLFRQPLADGRPALTLERHDGLGFRIFAHGYGHWLVSPDGSSIRAPSAGGMEDWLWERFLVGQVLPFATLLEGLEVFHAAGVVLDDRVVAIVGGSGVGKTSIGLNLVLLGMSFFTDDVLALELRDRGVVCMPGAGAANVRDARLRRLIEQGESRVGRITGRGSQSLRVALERDQRELPLGAVYFLDRSGEHRGLAFEPTVDPRLLLASTFNFVIRTPERLETQLEACARVASSSRLFRVAVPWSLGAADVAAEIHTHARAALTGGGA